VDNSVVKSKLREMETQNLDHLGIVVGIIDAIGVVEIINELIVLEIGEKVSPGHVVKAMIINGLGFV
jgi:hypothetical protein